MFINETLLNPATVFELPEVSETHSVDRSTLPDNWIDLLCAALNTLSEQILISRDTLSKHIDGTYSYKESLLDSLAYLYDATRRATASETDSDELKSRFTTLTLRLIDEAKNCTHGFHNRLNSIILSLQATHDSLSQMLYDFRMYLIERAAQKTSPDVHVFNRFYQVANASGIGVHMISKLDTIYQIFIS